MLVEANIAINKLYSSVDNETYLVLILWSYKDSQFPLQIQLIVVQHSILAFNHNSIDSLIQLSDWNYACK